MALTPSDTDVQDDGPDRQPAEPGALDRLVEDARDDLAQYFTANPTEFLRFVERKALSSCGPTPWRLQKANSSKGDVEIELIEIYGKSAC